MIRFQHSILLSFVFGGAMTPVSKTTADISNSGVKESPQSEVPDFVSEHRVTTPFGKPAVGSKITAVVSLADSEETASDPYRIETITDSAGVYALKIPGKFMKDERTVLRITIFHADYATYQSSNFALSQITEPGNPRNRRLAFLRQDIRNIRLKPIQRIVGKILLPDGTPAVGAKIVTASRYRPYSWKFIDPHDYPIGNFATSDELGKFQIDADRSATLTIQYDGYAPILLDNVAVSSSPTQQTGAVAFTKRIFRLKKGVTVRGLIRDKDGKPMPRVLVAMSRAFGFSETDPKVSFSYSVITNEKGKYEMTGVRPDEYTIRVGDRLREPSSSAYFPRSAGNSIAALDLTFGSKTIKQPKFEKHSESFISKTVSISSVDTQTIDIQALASAEVVVQIQYPDEKPDPEMNPGGGNIKGEHEGAKFYRRGRADENGILKIRVPIGLEKAHVDVGISVFQFGRNNAFEIGNSIHLPKIEHSITDIVNIRPKLLDVAFKITAPKGEQLKKTSLHGHYIRKGFIERTTERSDVPLYVINAGDAFKIRVLPNEEFVVYISAEGKLHQYPLKEHKFKIRRNDTREIEIKLEPLKES